MKKFRVSHHNPMPDGKLSLSLHLEADVFDHRHTTYIDAWLEEREILHAVSPALLRKNQQIEYEIGIIGIAPMELVLLRIGFATVFR